MLFRFRELINFLLDNEMDSCIIALLLIVNASTVQEMKLVMVSGNINIITPIRFNYNGSNKSQ